VNYAESIDIKGFLLCNYYNMKKNKCRFILLFTFVLLFVFVPTGCELLKAPDDFDILTTIDNEVAWANAANLNLTVAYPLEWGSSPQRGTGNAGDVRVGFAFEVEFTPSPAYSLIQWRAYETSLLPESWLDDPEHYLDEIPQLNNVILPIVGAGGGIGLFTINTTQPVTLIPWCRDMPRIIRTDPAMNIDDGLYNRMKNITIYFAAPINGSTAIFAPNHIEITMRVLNANGNPTGDPIHIEELFFRNPVLNSQQTMITIEVGTNAPPDHSEITVKIGTEVTSNLNNNGMDEPVIFSWKIMDLSHIDIDWWEAYYIEATRSIAFEWSLDGIVPFQVFYFLNDGVRQNAFYEGITDDLHRAVISNVQPLEISGVTSGRAETNIQQ